MKRERERCGVVVCLCQYTDGDINHSHLLAETQVVEGEER